MDIQEEIYINQEGNPKSPTHAEIAKAIFREVGETILIALVIILVIQFVIKNFRVEGHSMEPNLHHGQYLVIDKVSYRLPYNLSPPQRGDIIVFASPTQVGKDYIKRIIALPGETVEIKEGQILVNNQTLPNSFKAKVDQSYMAPKIIGDDELFVLGDNRPNSSDSRIWGTLKIDNVIGKAWLSYWPAQYWGFIPNNAPVDSGKLSHLFDSNE